MIKKIKRKLANVIYDNIDFPKACESGNELDWMLKDNCPCCLAHPIESLSNAEYHEKYPAKNILNFGVTKIYLCDVHMKELQSVINNEKM